VGAFARLAPLGDTVEAFDVLGDLWRADSSSFGVREWANLQDQFSSWAGARLEEASEWFDDLDDLDRVEMAAANLDVSLDETRLDTAREEVYEAVTEREAAALEGVEPDDDRDDDWRGVGPTDSAQIDALFATLNR
jgi:hypothetical protein